MPTWAATYRLTWQDVATGETSWRIERCVAESCTYAELTPAAAANATTYDDATAADGTNYKYRVRAGYAGGVYSVYSNEVCRPTDCSPAAPMGVHIAGQAVPPQILLVASTTSATYWTGILAPVWGIDWTKAGVTGGIPTDRTQCGDTVSAGSSAAAIQAVIDACTAGHYVLLESGNYPNLTAGLNLKSGVTLRGAGPDATKLIFTGTGANNCSGLWASICFEGNDLTYYAADSGPSNIVNWTAGYAKGTTSITLASTPNLSVGQWIVLDQQNDTADTGNMYTCAAQYTGAPGTCSDESGGGGEMRNCASGDSTCRAQHQWVKVLSCTPACGDAGAKTVVIDRPLYAPNWAAARGPQAYWGSTSGMGSGMGLEDLSIDTQANPGMNAIGIIFASDSWVKHIRALYAPAPRRTFIQLYSAPRNTIRDSYFYGTYDDSGTSEHYGIEEHGSGDCLVENNIIQRRTSPFVRDSTAGAVYGYNFAIDNVYKASPTFMQADQYSHLVGNHMILSEGNSGLSAKGDIVHGTSNFFTYFRNYFIGWETGKTSETNPVQLYAFARYYAFVGNVLGKMGYHTSYQTVNAGNPVSIYILGRGGQGSAPSDTVVSTTVLRWGNYSVVAQASDTPASSGIRFVASEVPSGIAAYPNPVPASQTLPPSFYLSAKPSWWGTSLPWPGIGPDITGGTGPGGHAYYNPAEQCFRTVMTDDLAYSADSSGTRPKHFTCTYPMD